MQIDWLTVTAQVVNFLVLVWLLHRFLYGPITRAMARREQLIADRLNEAQHEKEAAESEAEVYRQKQEELAQQRDHMLSQARAAAEDERRALERVAREDVEARKREWLGQLEAERETFLRDLRERCTEEFYTLARRAFEELASAELEEQIALAFVRQLEALDKSTDEKIVRGCAEAGGTVTVRSRFELSANAKRHITRVLHERLGEGANVEYDINADIACGIELEAGSQTVSWSIASYLDGFERAVAEQISAVSASPQESTDG